MENPARRRLEEMWRERVEAARENYRFALAQWRRAQTEHRSQPKPSNAEKHSLPQALRREIRARARYVRVLRSFTRLILHGEVPNTDDV